LDDIKLQLKGLQEIILKNVGNENLHPDETPQTRRDQIHFNPSTQLDGSTNQLLPQQMMTGYVPGDNKEFEKRKIVELSQAFGVDPDSTVDIYGGPPTQMIKYSRVNNHGILSWIATLLNDPFLNPLYTSTIGKYKCKTPLVPPWFKAKMAKTPENKEFAAQFLDRTGMSEVRPLDEDSKHCEGSSKKKTTKQVSQSEENQSSREYYSFVRRPPEKKSIANLRKCILQILPTKKVIWMLIDRFFIYIYPFCPCLDENEFIDKICGIIGPLSMEETKIDKLNVLKLLDVANIGSLLLVLKLAWLSLRSNSEEELDNPGRTTSEKYLLEHPISKDLALTAQMCIDEFNLLGRCSLDLLQTLLLMKFFKNVTGSDGFSDGRQQVFLSLLTHIGISIGLNRDPSKYSGVGDINHSHEILRKIWYSLEWYSTLQSISLGLEPQIDSRYYDTRLPKFSRKTSNVRNLDVETETVNGIIQQHEISIMVNEVFETLLDMKHPPTVGDILYMMDKIEIYLNKRWGSLSNILTLNDGVYSNNLSKARDIHYYTQLAMLLFSIFHHLLLAFEREQNCHACFHFLEKCLFYSFEVSNHVAEIMEHSYRYIGTGLDYFIDTCLEITTHNCLLIQISLYIRLCCLEKSLQEQQKQKSRFRRRDFILEKITKLKNDMLNNNFMHILKHFRLVKDHTFFAWLTMGICSSIFRFLRENKVKAFTKKYNFLSHLTEEELLSLLSSTEKYICKKNGKPTEKAFDPEAEFEKADTNLAADFDKLWANSMQAEQKQDDSPQKKLPVFQFPDDLALNWQSYYDFAFDPMNTELFGKDKYNHQQQEFGSESGATAADTNTPGDETGMNQQGSSSYFDAWTGL